MMLRAQAIGAAIAAELERRRPLLDRDSQLAQVTITIKLRAGSVDVRGLVWEELRVRQNGKGGETDGR